MQPEPTPTPEETTCGHHWQITTANGPVSTGVCRKCSEVRSFNNSLENAGWKEDGFVSLRNRRRGSHEAP